MSINRVCISGNLGNDAELRNTASGMGVLSFNVAVSDRRKNIGSGDWEDYTNWIPCTMFGTRAEKLAQYLTKGTKVAIEGKLRWSQWEKDGQKRSKVEVIVDDVELMSGEKRQQPAQQYSAPRPAQQQMQHQGYQPQGYAANPPQMGYQQPQQAYGQPQYQQPQQPQVIQAQVGLYDEDVPF